MILIYQNILDINHKLKRLENLINKKLRIYLHLYSHTKNKNQFINDINSSFNIQNKELKNNWNKEDSNKFKNKDESFH